MLIGIEASRANRLKKTGVEWYAFHLIEELKKRPDAEAHSWLLYTNEPLSHGMEKGQNNWHERALKWPPKYLWTQIRLSIEMLRHKPEVLFVPAHVLPRFAPKRSVVTIHDVGFRRMPKLYPWLQRAYHEWATKDIAKHAARILTVSEFSKRELVELYGIPAEKIMVTYLGVEHHIYKPVSQDVIQPVLKTYQISAPYILCIGRLETKKNILTLIEGFNRYKEERGAENHLKLVLVGQPGSGYEEIEEAIVHSPFQDQIILTGYISEADKVALLSGALAYVHPSWYEGFGLPPLEAMACETAVLSSTAGSLLEVLGEENALFFHPEDAEGLVKGLHMLTDDAELVRDLRRRGLAHAAQFRWERTAAETFRALTAW